MEAREKETLGGRPQDVVVARASGSGDEVRSLLDAETHLPSRLVYKVSDKPKTVDLTDWRPVEGILMPFHQKMASENFVVAMEAVVIELDPTLKPDFFTAPSQSVVPLCPRRQGRRRRPTSA